MLLLLPSLLLVSADGFRFSRLDGVLGMLFRKGLDAYILYACLGLPSFREVEVSITTSGLP